MIILFTLLKQSAVQNKISQAKSSLGKFEKISTLGKNPLYGIRSSVCVLWYWKQSGQLNTQSFPYICVGPPLHNAVLIIRR